MTATLFVAIAATAAVVTVATPPALALADWLTGDRLGIRLWVRWHDYWMQLAPSARVGAE